MAPSHYQIQCRLTNKILWHSSQGSVYLNTQDINLQDAFQIYTFNVSQGTKTYHQTSNIWLTLVGNKIVDLSDVAGASPASTKTIAKCDEKPLSLGIWCTLY